MKPIEFTVNFNSCCCHIPSISSIFAALKVLEEKGIVKIKKYNMDPAFADRSTYPHRYVVELKSSDKTLIYDMSDGYQDFDFPEIFDSQLEKTDFFFKSSYDENFAQKLKNKEKFQILGMAYGCSYPGNHFEKACIKKAFKEKNYKQALYYLLKTPQLQRQNDFRKFECNNHFDSYKLLHWTRLWEYDLLNVENIMKAYPLLSREQAKEKTEQQISMIKQINSDRIETMRLLRDAFGDRFVGGLSDNKASRNEAPDLITSDPRITTREGYLNSLKNNYIHILSKGVHGCVGARYGETFAAGRALITDPFVYEPAGNLKEGENYLSYTSPDEVVRCAAKLIEDIDTVHRMEDNNFLYYNNYVRPDVRLLNTLKIAFPESFK